MITELTLHDMLEPQSSPDKDVRILMCFGSTCGPCKATLPFYEQVAEYYVSKTNRIKFYKMNAWEPAEQKDYCYNTLKISGVPHFKAFCSGQEILERVGGGNDVVLKQFIHDVIDEAFKRFGEKI